MLRKKSGLPKNCSFNVDRHGQRRCRFRKLGFSTYLTGTPWSPEFMQQYAKAVDGVKTQATEAGSARTTPGSFNALAVAYYRSADFSNLRPSTQGARRNIIEKFRKDHGSKPIKDLTRAHVKAIIEARADKPEAANSLLKTLHIMLSYAVEQEMIEINVASGVKKYRSRGDGHHTWTEDEIATFEAYYPVGSRPRLALALGLHTAQRRSEVIRMGWQHVKGDSILVRQQKTGTELEIPLSQELKMILASTPKTNMTFLMTEKGAPFTDGGFGNWWRDRCNKASLPRHCKFHGLRKSSATRLADAGCSIPEVMAVTGHKSMKEVAHYIRAANQKRLAKSALETLARSDSEQNCPTLTSRVDQYGK